MTGHVFGRTNQVYPPVWVRPEVPADPYVAWQEDYRDALLGTRTVIDISGGPTLWGEILRDAPNPLIATVGRDLDTSVDFDQACDAVQAEFLQILSGIGRMQIEMLVLRIPRTLEDFQLEGALQTLEYARQETMVKFVGLQGGASALATRNTWQFHDAFEFVVVERDDELGSLSELARDRRVGMVWRGISAPANPVDVHLLRCGSVEAIRGATEGVL